jgi:hypothetical protein
MSPRLGLQDHACFEHYMKIVIHILYHHFNILIFSFVNNMNRTTDERYNNLFNFLHIYIAFFLILSKRFRNSVKSVELSIGLSMVLVVSSLLVFG